MSSQKNITRKNILFGVGVVAMYCAMKRVARKHSEDPGIDKNNSYLGDTQNFGLCGKNRSQSIYENKVKPILDMALSFTGLVILSPVYAMIAAAIYIDDPGPVFFTQKRVGKGKHFFALHKFRSMKMDTPHDIPTHQLQDPDQYITRVGRILRKTSLDELPQIWDIFRGRMSIIGPRPALFNQTDLVEEREKYGANSVMPGLTGLAQIKGRDELEIPVKAAIDGEYVKILRRGGRKAFLQDICCFIGTIGSVLKHDGVVEGGTGQMHRTELISRGSANDKSTQNIRTSSKVRISKSAMSGKDGRPVNRDDVGFEDYGCYKTFDIDKSRSRRVLITGAGSYIGESFAAYATVHYPNLVVDTIDTVDGSWRDYDFSGYDAVFHVAGIAHADVGNVDEETKRKYYAVNRDLALETAQKAKNSHVSQFIYMSSMIIYGDSAPYGTEKVIDEHTLPSPGNFYGDSKWQADKKVRMLRDSHFHVAVLRPPMIYGKGSKGNYPILAKVAKLLPFFPDIDNQRSMLHIDNLCEFLCLLVLSGEGGIYFPQNREYTKTSDMVKEIGKAAGRSVRMSRLLNPVVKIASHVPGKVSDMANKAFGNCIYKQCLSTYKGLDYQVHDLKASIELTEGNRQAIPSNFKIYRDDKLTDLHGKRVLLIALPGYCDGILKKMKELGADADLINDKPNEGFICKTLGRYKVGFYQYIINDYYRRKLKPLKDRKYDYILSIRGEYTPIETLELLKNYYPRGKRILYMWDGLGKLNTKGIEDKWPYYDRVYTFDRVDYEAHKNQISFLPLFYYEDYLPDDFKDPNRKNFTYDLSFVGTGHDDRIRIVKDVMRQCERNSLRCFSYFFVPHPFVYLRDKLVNRNYKNVGIRDVRFKMMPFEKLYEIYADSRCVIDIENKGQHGLTMRSIEILGLCRKFITTNKDIVNYDFYNVNNILVLDRNHPVLDMSFFDKPYQRLDERIYQKYSLKNWILEVLK